LVIGAGGADVGGQNNRGAAYIFARNQGGADQWGLVKKLTAADGTAGDWFGDTVAISGDFILVGADYADISGRVDQGATYVFARNLDGANNWGQWRKLTADDGAAYHYFGGAVALSGDTAVVGAWGADVSGKLCQGAAYVFARNQGGADNWGQLKKLAAADGAAYDRFGYAVAINAQADAVLVGAYYASVDGAARRGAAYIFTRNLGGSPDSWGQVKKLLAGDGAANDYFGRSVAICGELALVGAVGDDASRGSAYLFDRNQDGANLWGQLQKLTAQDGAAGDQFGIALAGDEETGTFILGAPGDDSWRGAAYLFDHQAENWSQRRKTTAPDGATDDNFGTSVALSGDTLVVGANAAKIGGNEHQGATYVFARNWGGADSWGLVKKMAASDGAAEDLFGSTVAISGDTLVVGAVNASFGGLTCQGAAYVFARNWGGADNWGQVKKLTASDGQNHLYFSSGLALSDDTLVVGAPDQLVGSNFSQGAAYVFARNRGGADNWGQVKKLIASDGVEWDVFGDSVAISGDTLVVGAPEKTVGDNDDLGAAYVFARNQGGKDNWGQVRKLTASDGAAPDTFGYSVAISGDTLAVGAPSVEVGSNDDQGAAYVFARNWGGADNWGRVRKLIASDGAAQDSFGWLVAISGEALLVGAAWADVGGNDNQGAAYVFARNQGGADTWGQVRKLTASDGGVHDFFGWSAAISGSTLLVGAIPVMGGDQGAVYLYQEAPLSDLDTLYVRGASGIDSEACGAIGAPCQTISYTLNNRVNDGDTLLIAGGTYVENLTLGDGLWLTLHGGYAVSGNAWLPGTAETIIDGSGATGQPVVVVGDGATVLLHSLTLTGGRASGAGGIRAGDADVTIRNCVIRNNTALGDGGGGVQGSNTRWTIIDSRVIGNRIESAAGPGTTGGAGGIRAGASVTLVNTVVADNLGDAGIHANASLTLLNSTVANNDGDIIFNPLSAATLAITNSIVYGQLVFLEDCPAGSDCHVNYSDVQGWTGAGSGNIQADPRFLGAGDYHLRVGSPCIDKGTPTGAPATDIEGHPRDALPDMGAYEWKGFRIYLPLTLRNFGP
jgi:hypothetical protein